MHDFIAKELIDKTILLTGGTGFLGKNILKYLKNNQIKYKKITILTRDANKFKTLHPDLAHIQNLDYMQQNMTDLSYGGASYDYIIHAGTSVVEKVSEALLLNEIITGAKNVLEYAKKCKAKSVINLSSGAVYGNIDKCIAATEDSMFMPKIESSRSSYGIGKLVSEHYGYLYAADDMKVTSLRCFCFGGEYLDADHYALGQFVRQSIKNEDIIVQAGSGIYRSYLSTEDLSQAILYTMIKANDREANYEVYNVGSDEAITIPDLAMQVCRVLGSKSQVICPNLNNKQISYYVPNVDKIRKTGLAMSSKLEDIILNVQKYYLSQVK